jgi:hypothetical protein
LKNILKEKADFAWRELISLTPKNSTALWRHGKFLHTIYKTSLKSNEPIKFCVTSKIKLLLVKNSQSVIFGNSFPDLKTCIRYNMYKFTTWVCSYRQDKNWSNRGVQNAQPSNDVCHRLHVFWPAILCHNLCKNLQSSYQLELLHLGLEYCSFELCRIEVLCYAQSP